MKLKPDHPRFDVALDLEVGDRVRWPADAPKAREGVIVAVVRDEDDPYKCIPAGMKPPPSGYGKPRTIRSFLVKVKRGTIAYWPRVSMIAPVINGVSHVES